MKQMTQFPDKFQPQATRALTFIRHQLFDVTQYCDHMLQSGLVSQNSFLELENYLQKILYEMEQFSNKDLPQATRAFTFIQRQLMELAENCGNTLQNCQLSPNHFLELDNKLKRMIYQTYAACSPPPIKPVKSDFILVKPVASGFFGTVNLVRHNQTHEVLAMKKIKVKSKVHRDIVLMEREVMSYLDHPLFPSLFCSFEEKDNLYIVMEYIGGGDCLSLFCKRSLCSEEVARFYTAELTLAVEYIHRLGIIHMDIKPDNMMITASGHLKLVDFGLSTICSVKTTACVTEEDCLRVAREFSGEVQCGTDFYVAPEVWLRKGYGTPIDWWATGVTFFGALYGTLPFNYKEREDLINHVVNGDIAWPVRDHPVSDEAQSLVRLLLQKDPVKRLGTRGASEVKQHSFFKGIDWTNLLNQTPPFVPVLENEEDTSCFDAMPDHVSSSTKEDQEEYMDDKSPVEAADFSYVAFNFSKVYSPEPLSPCMLAGHEEEKVKSKSPLLMKTEPEKKKKKNLVKRFFIRLWKLNPFRHFQKTSC